VGGATIVEPACDELGIIGWWAVPLGAVGEDVVGARGNLQLIMLAFNSAAGAGALSGINAFCTNLQVPGQAFTGI
jgi:hypothetical protein